MVSEQIEYCPYLVNFSKLKLFTMSVQKQQVIYLMENNKYEYIEFLILNNIILTLSKDELSVVDKR